ncbi:hypothetical protein CFOL_v3_19777 [Cephalotus follicularis]|uniref:Uncharacterized protein n=1 Tax=Cephalotus follicularis TaxID=3775 RepID=A0A1Q3C869_CEPFO|nr:hypothetical protein CFOL_v3_19777 [Cephalotus follicularis]
MDNMACNKVQPIVRKPKKKQVKDELDRIKQAEKKKRRLEKALATSAAIRCELEKKKQKKKEEQQRLDAEGAAIAEAVALHVLLGEDSDDPCKIVLNKEDGFDPWGCAGDIDIFVGGNGTCLSHQDHANCTLEGIGWVSNTSGSVYKWADAGNSDWSVSYRPIERNVHAPYFEDGGWGTTEFSAGVIAAQAVSSLQIAEDSQVDTIVLNGMLRR